MTARSISLARRRRLTKVGRSAVVWALLLYVVATVILCATLDRWSPRMTDRVWLRKRKRLRELAATAADRPLLVMLGSSRTEGALDAGRLNGLAGPRGEPLVAYNCGVPGVGPLHELVFLREMLDMGIRPDLLLVEYLPPLLNRPQRGRTSEEGWINPPWLTTSQFTRMWPYLCRPARARREWIQSRVAPYHVFRLNLHTRLRQKLSLHPPCPRRPHDPYGQLLNISPPPAECAERTRIARDMYHDSLGELELGKGPCKAVRDLLECCRRERIAVVLVLLPESSEFRTWYRPEGLADARVLLRNLQQACAVPVIDATAWVADTDFIDGHHLDRSGARVFTDRLVKTLWPMLGWSRR
jgi:hypothetical protein